MLGGQHMASCKPDDLAKWHFFIIIFIIHFFYILAQGWFIELNLLLSSDAVCMRSCNVFLAIFVSSDKKMYVL